MDYITIMFRTILFYFLVVLIYRLMGKREVGQLGVIDLIISFLIAELAAISIENFKDDFLFSFIPIVLLTLMQILISYLTLHFPKFRRFLDGDPSVIIKHGKINFKEMLKQRYNLDDLLSQLREKNIKSLKEVEYAILESNGQLSVFKYNLLHLNSNSPLPLVLDGKINMEGLKLAKKNTTWLKDALNKNKVTLDNVFYAFIEGNKIYIIKKDSLN